MILSYLKYFTTAKRISKSNSVVIQKLNEQVFSKTNTVNDSVILNLISQLKQDKSTLNITDLGAGSKQSKSNVRSIASIAKNAAIPPKFGRLLNKIIQTYQCKTIIELGTSLGIGTAYLAIDNEQSTIYTIEGCPNISKVAQSQLKALNINNVNFFVGEFSSQFNDVLSHFNQADFVYIDGNHTYEATINYFNFFLSKMSKNGILIFDDIHWSKGMEKAWQQIVEHQSSKLTIDLFRMGIVFLNPDLKKEHLILKY